MTTSATSWTIPRMVTVDEEETNASGSELAEPALIRAAPEIAEPALIVSPPTLAEPATDAQSEPDPGSELVTQPVEPASAIGSAEAREKAAATPLVPLTITRLDPSSGALGGGTRLVIEGTGFVEASEVRVADVPVPVVFESSARLVCTTLARSLPGRADVKVINPDAQWTVVLFGYEYCVAPELAAITPDRAAMTGGTRATLSGAGFREGCDVRVGAASVRVEFVSSTRVDVEIPAHPAGDYDVELTNPDAQTTKLAKAFRFDSAPSVSGVFPGAGVLAGGTAVGIEGDGFRTGAKLFLNGVGVPTVFISSTRLSAATPASTTPGSVAARVVNPDGLSAELANAFRYEQAEPPRIQRLEPARGVPGQPTQVAIIGEGFSDGCRVVLSPHAPPVRFVSPERLEVSLPAFEHAGLLDVHVENPDGQSHLATNAFELRGAPVLASIDPREGSRGGDQVVTLVGSGFDLDCSVVIGGFVAKCEWQSAGRLRATVPANHDADSVDVVVTNSDGQSGALVRAFTYAGRVCPEVTRLEPTSGPTTGSAAVKVTGSHLDLVSQVLVDGEPSPSFKTKGTEELAFLTPARRSEGMVDVEFRTREGGRIVRKKAYQYKAVPAPKIGSISPNRGAVSGGTAVTISGEHFVTGSIVLVDGKTAAAVQLRNATTIELAMPPGEAGRMVDVAVKSPTGQETALKRAFLYDPRHR